LGVFDTTLAPPRAQYGVVQGKAEKERQLRYGAPAILCNLLQRLNYHS
jgi:hypothetical protein